MHSALIYIMSLFTGSASLEIHQKTCFYKFKWNQKEIPKKFRKVIPEAHKCYIQSTKSYSTTVFILVRWFIGLHMLQPRPDPPTLPPPGPEDSFDKFEAYNTVRTGI